MKKPKSKNRFNRFIKNIYTHTPFATMMVLLIVLWLLFSTGIYLAERNTEGATIHSFVEALYWGVAAFSTVGTADTPTSGMAQLLGGLWMIIGSVLFFVAIISTVTSYFMRPMQRPHMKIIDTIEYNLEQINDLSDEELDLLKDTINTLIEHVESMKTDASTSSDER